MGCTVKNGRVMDQSGCTRCNVICDEGYYRMGSIAYCNKTVGKWLDPLTNLPPCYLPGPPIKMFTFPSWRSDTISPWILQKMQHIPKVPITIYPKINITQYHQQISGSQTGGYGRVIVAAFGVLFLLCAIPALIAKYRKSRSQPGKILRKCSTTEARRRQLQTCVERETRMDEVHIEELQREELRWEGLQREEVQREKLQGEEHNESRSGITDLARLNTEDQSNDVHVHWSAFPNSPEPSGFLLQPPYDAERVFNPVYEMSESMDLGITPKTISETYQTPSDPDDEHSNGIPEATPPPYSEKV